MNFGVAGPGKTTPGEGSPRLVSRRCSRHASPRFLITLRKRLVDIILAFRFGIDQNAVGLEQAILADFIKEGHLGRHMRRMRDLYANRLQTLRREGEKHLKGLLEIPDVRAGLYAVGFLRNGMSSRQAELAAMSLGIETMALDRFMLSGTDPQGIVLGFAAFEDHVIRRGVAALAIALSKRDP